jgi:DNA-3-methyladenine glycosylase
VSRRRRSRTERPEAAWGARLARARPLPRAFYATGPRALARALLGRVLVHDDPAAGRLAGLIVETEAYAGRDDPASHAYRGETPRNRVMFGAPGHAYVYFTYGMHHCVNVVTGREGQARAILVRALEPLAGVPLMRRRRAIEPAHRLARGPGCVTAALGLSRANDGADLTCGPLWIADRPPVRPGRVVRTPRIGIRVATEWPWRFAFAGHPCVSGPPIRPEGAAGRVSGRSG